METTPWQSKPGIDWANIEARVKAGETFADISRSLAEEGVKISAWAINKRARKGGWLSSSLPQSTDWLALCHSTSTAQALTAPHGRAQSMIATMGVRTPKRMAEILSYVHAGASPTAAAQAAGTNKTTLASWRSADPEFEELLSRAEGKMLVRNLQRIDRAAEQDWRAADRLLSSLPSAREHWTPNVGGPQVGGVTVVINVKRAYDVEPTIDLTPASPPAQEPSGPVPSTR